MPKLKLLFVLCALVAAVSGDTTRALQGPYAQWLQQDVPFGNPSYFLNPWRSYMDTWPASKYLNSLGLGGITQLGTEAVATVFEEAGIGYNRIEIGWGSFQYHNVTQLQPAALTLLQTILPIQQRHGIRPVFLLNANSGAPCPLFNFKATVTATAGVASRTIQLSTSVLNNVVIGKTGLTGQPGIYQTAWPLITAVDNATGVCQLSAPLVAAISSGTQITLVTLLYHPFSPLVYSDNTTSPWAMETVNGWMTYVSSLFTIVREILGTAGTDDVGFDAEVWNEYSFGSQFLADQANYYSPALGTKVPVIYSNWVQNRTGVEIILPMTVDFANDPKNGFPGVNVLSGFSNERPWDTLTQLWPGQTGFSRHYYTTFQAENISAAENPDPQAIITNALGKLEGHYFPNGTIQPSSEFIPTYSIACPEWWFFGNVVENVVRDLQPFPSSIYGTIHYRYGSPNNDGKLGQVWMTETNTGRATISATILAATGFTTTDPRYWNIMHWLGAKTTLRTFLFASHKGLQTTILYAAQQSDGDLAVIPEIFFTTLKQNDYVLNDTVRQYIGPQLLSVGRVTNIFKSEGIPIDVARHLTLTELVEHNPYLVLAGNGSSDPAHPNRYHADDFACLPFQMDSSLYEIAYYVVTRDMNQVWNASAPIWEPDHYAMPPQTFDLTLANIRGLDAQVSVFDPLTNTSVGVTLLTGNATSITVRVEATDSPRLLRVQESQQGPLVLSAVLCEPVSGGTIYQLSFSSTVPVTAEVTWGSLPNRTSLGNITFDQAMSFAAAISTAEILPGDGVQIRLTDSNGLIALWPRWGWDTIGLIPSSASVPLCQPRSSTSAASYVQSVLFTVLAGVSYII